MTSAPRGQTTLTRRNEGALTRRGALRVVGCAGAALCAHALGCAPAVGGDAGVSDETTKLFDVPAAGAAPLLDVDARLALVRVEDRVYAHSSVCTHEQCLVGVDEDDAVFDCPCHGARFAQDGAVLAPPATRSLDRHPLSFTSDGRVEVDVTVRLRQGDAGYDDAFLLAPS